MYFVYVLFSAMHKRTYVGQTNNLESRLRMHNSGRVRSTKAHVPWRIIHTKTFATRAEAMAREHHLKSPLGRIYLHNLLEAIASEK